MNDSLTLNLATRHHARRLAYWNGLLWSIGNGLCSSTLVIYLAMELHAKQIGLGIGLILAARYFIGVLQLGAPAVLDRWGDRKRFCLISFGLSGLLLLSLPFFAAPNVLLTAKACLAALVILWCLHHLMQYLGMIAFLSWLADLVPGRIRGRFFGLRNRWLCRRRSLGGDCLRGVCRIVASNAYETATLDRLRHSRRTGSDLHVGGHRADLADAPRGKFLKTGTKAFFVADGFGNHSAIGPFSPCCFSDAGSPSRMG